MIGEGGVCSRRVRPSLSGCTNSSALNYDVSAVTDDGSCCYGDDCSPPPLSSPPPSLSPPPPLVPPPWPVVGRGGCSRRVRRRWVQSFVPELQYSLGRAGDSYFFCRVHVSGTLFCMSEDPDVWKLHDGEWSSVSCGSGFACAVSRNGSVSCFHPFGGNLTVPALASAPSGVGWSSVSSGYLHACAVSSVGSVECWGEGVPTFALPVSGLPVRSVSCGYLSTCVLSSSGALLCSGGGGALGSPPSGNFTSVSVGFYHACGSRWRRPRVLGRFVSLRAVPRAVRRRLVFCELRQWQDVRRSRSRRRLAVRRWRRSFLGRGFVLRGLSRCRYQRGGR